MTTGRISSLHFASATQLMRALESGETTSVDLLELFLQRIENLTPSVNAVVTIDADRARDLARAADGARSAGQSWGPLHGVPMTVKDEFEVDGMRSTFGVRDFADHESTYDAASVAGLRAAGAIIFGKSNMPAYAADLQSNNEVFGLTRNPWDLERTPGGSSGGSAAALAAGLTGLELGSDMGGSIRVPAAWTGVYGHKPSPGLISQFGDVGYAPRYATLDLFTPGPMARGADDLRLGLHAMMSFDASGPRATTTVLADPTISRLEGVRVAAWLDDAACGVSDDVVAVLERTVRAIEGAGCVVTRSPTLPLPTQEMIDLWEQLFAAAAWAEDDLKAFEEIQRAEPGRFPITQVVLASARMPHAEWLAADERRSMLSAEWARFFDDYDVLLCPAAVVAAPEHHPLSPLPTRTLTINGKVRPYWDIFTWTGLTTLGNLPATVAPVGLTTGGLPVGVQIAAAPGRDLTTIRFASLVEPILGGFVPPPLFAGADASDARTR